MENTGEKKTLITKKGSELYAECITEYVLPDYKTDIKRVLHTEAHALPAGKFLGEGEAEFSGVGVFDVLYLDSENNLNSVTFTGDYSAHTSVSEGVSDAWAEPRAENVSVRLPGPRKILARCVFALDVSLEETLNCEVEGNTFLEENSPVFSLGTVNSAHVLHNTLADREYAEEYFTVLGAVLDDVEIITKRAEVKITSAAVKDGAVSVCGEIELYSLIRNGEEIPRVKSLGIPFEETVTAQGARDDMCVCAFGTISSLECRTEPLDDGVRVCADVIVDFDVCVYENRSANFVVDAYSSEYETVNRYETVKCKEFFDGRHAVAKASRQIAKSNTDAPMARDIVYMSMSASVENVRIDASSVLVEGEVRFSGVACEIYEDGTPTYTSLKFSVPFSENVNFSSQIPTGASVECKAVAHSGSVTLDEDNFYAECGVFVDVMLLTEHEISRLCSSEVAERTEDAYAASVITVYYPESTDTLFGVAKKFKVSPLKIAADNALSEEAMSLQNSSSSLNSVKKLIIRKM